jgi:succinoglycan biosynthesis transport protein ExoP
VRNGVNEPSPYLLNRSAIPAGGRARTTLWPSASAHADTLSIWRIVRRHVALVLGCLLGTVLVVGIIVFSEQRRFTAKGTVMIEPDSPRVLDIKQLNPEETGTQDQDHGYYKTQFDILESRTLAAEVIRDLNLERDSAFRGEIDSTGPIARVINVIRAARRAIFSWGASSQPTVEEGLFGASTGAIDAYLHDLAIEPLLGARLVAVEFTSPNAALSAKVANAHIQTYIKRGLELRTEAATNASTLLASKLVALKKDVTESERALNDYRHQRGIISFSLNGRGKMVSDQLGELNHNLIQAESNRITLEAQVELIHNGNYDALPEVANNTLIQQLKAQVSDLSQRYAELSNRFNPGYHPLDDLKARLDESQQKLRKETGNIVGEIQNRYKAAASEQEKIAAKIAEVKGQAIALNDMSVDDAVLARDVEANRTLYESVLKRLNELRVAANVPTSNISVVDPAEPPRVPSSPRIGLALGMASLLGLLGGIGIAVVLESRDDRFRSPEEASARIALPILAQIPDLSEAAGRLPAYDAAMLGDRASGQRMLPAGETDGAAVAWKQTAIEAYQKLRTTIRFSRAFGAPKTLLLTSSLPLEGKTTTSVNLAAAFARTGGKVLLVDGDMRSPLCHELLGVSNDSGLSEVLTGQKTPVEVIQQTKLAGLYLLSSGTIPPNPGELLESQKMRDLLVELTQLYDWILIDSPPVMIVSDALAISPSVEGVLLIVDSEASARVVSNAASSLKGVGAQVLGMVFNRSQAQDFLYYYDHRQAPSDASVAHSLTN